MAPRRSVWQCTNRGSFAGGMRGAARPPRGSGGTPPVGEDAVVTLHQILNFLGTSLIIEIGSGLRQMFQFKERNPAVVPSPPTNTIPPSRPLSSTSPHNV